MSRTGKASAPWNRPRSAWIERAQRGELTPQDYTGRLYVASRDDMPAASADGFRVTAARGGSYTVADLQARLGIESMRRESGR